jgi:hypothetical protein
MEKTLALTLSELRIPARVQSREKCAPVCVLGSLTACGGNGGGFALATHPV